MQARRRASLAALLVGAVALPLGLVVGTAGTVSANAPCGNPAPSDVDHSDYVTGADGGDVRNGSSTDCEVVGHADPNETLDYYCYTWNADNTHSWTYLRNVTGGAKGWVRDDHLPIVGGVHGSKVSCAG